jgi:DNA-binding NarL/FixJ family response regulator
MKDNSRNDAVTIILADDHPLLRKGLKDLIQEEGYKILGEAGDGEQALTLIRKLKPSIIIIDIQMPKLNGLEVIRILRKENQDVKAIVLTMHDKENIFNRAMDLGVKGYIMKDSVSTEIIEAIKSIIMGKYFISSSISGFLVKRSLGNQDDAYGISKLTMTENKILRMIADNLTSKEIADELFLSVHTVETHRSNICQKLHLRGTNALLHFVLEHPDLL